MDAILNAADTALRTLFAKPHASQSCPTLPDSDTTLSDAEKQQSIGLMRVNHVGEVCAQALYTAQALTTPNLALRTSPKHAPKRPTTWLGRPSGFRLWAAGLRC